MISDKIYEKCITNLACSILKEFDLDHNHNTIIEVDEFLENNNIENIVVILCDGMGTNILKNTLSHNDFLIKNLLTDINSVHPSTTTASTTSMLSGLNPSEHGWLGWDLYVKPIDKVVTLFLNVIKDTEIRAEDYHVAYKHFEYKNITERINNAGKYYSKILFPFGDDAYINLDDMLNRVNIETKTKGKKYIYAYFENPDSNLHEFGVGSKEANNVIKEINEKIEKLSYQLENTLLIVTADHGHKNVTPITLSEIPEIFELLETDISIEGRLCSFKIKSGLENEFSKQFNKLFSNDFILMTKEQVLTENLFGFGNKHSLFEASLGDFIAVAFTDKYFRYNENSILLKSMHAGITDDEMKIPLIIYHAK